MSPQSAQPSPPSDQAEPVRRELLSPGLGAPFRWLQFGVGDFLHAPWGALFYGFCFWAMALILGKVFQAMPEYTMSFVSGCFLVGPFLAMGLYDMARRREAGLPQDFGASLTCWDQRLSSMGMLVLILIVLELLWGRASLVVFAVFFNTGMPSTSSVLDAVLNPANWEFVAVYVAVGGVFAGLVFSTCVVSMPMILDRDLDAISAGVASLQAVGLRTGVMLLWGALIVGGVLLSLASPWSFALILVGPVLGLASWHAYRGIYRWVPGSAVEPN